MSYIERLTAETILVIVLGVTMLGGLIWFWPTATRALVLAGLFAAITIGFDIYAKLGEESAKAPSAAHDLIPLLIVGLFLLPMMGWGLAQVRSNIIDYVGSYSATVSDRALNDSSIEVRSRACRSITEYHNDTINFEELHLFLKNRHKA
jgi:hypothetical protein